MLIQKQTVTNHTTLKPQLRPFFIFLRGQEQELLQNQKPTSTLHSSLTQVFFSSLAIPIHPFLLCLLFSSSSQKTSPQWTSLKRDSLPSDRWTPFLTHFLPLSLDDEGGEILLEQSGKRPSDCHLLAYTSLSVFCKTSGQKGKSWKKTPETQANKWRWKSTSEAAAAGDPVLDSWITWAGAASHALLSTLTLRLLEQFSCLWKRTRFCCIFILPHCHYILTVLMQAQASVTVTSLQTRKGGSSPQTRLETRFRLLCVLGLLCSIDVCCVTHLAGGFLKQKEKKGIPQFPFPLRELPWLFSSEAAARLHRCCLSYLALVLFSSDNQGTPNTEAQTNTGGHQKPLFNFWDNFNHFLHGIFSWAWVHHQCDKRSTKM